MDGKTRERIRDKHIMLNRIKFIKNNKGLKFTFSNLIYKFKPKGYIFDRRNKC